MFMSSISLETQAVPAGDSAASAAQAALPAGTAEGGEQFAERFAQAMAATPGGQNLAAGALSLRTLALGPTLEVVTTPSDQPDADSLAEFAKAQGLDEDVVAWLFADPSLQGLPAAALVPPVMVTAPLQAVGMPPTLVSSGATASPAVALGAALPGLEIREGSALVGAGAPAVPGFGLPPAPATAPATATLTAGIDLALATTQTSAAPQQAVGTPPADSALAALLASSPTTNWVPTQRALPTTSPVDAPDVTTQPVASLSLAAALAAAAAQANQRPLQAGTGPAAAAKPATPDVPVETLTLEVEPELESLWDADSAMSQLPATPTSAAFDQSGAGGSSHPGQQDGTPEASTIAQRANHYQALSLRLGEALAQRIQSQVERGQWQVRMVLKPEKLGEVEIDLKMKAGEIDAAFRVSNPVTRELLNDGLPRLREILTSAGMDIADLNVGSGRSQQHGGNPTPRQAQTQPSAAAANPSNTAAAMAPAAPLTRRSGADGWDVLV